MKIHVRDRIAALLGTGLLLLLVALSYYYAVRTELIAIRTIAHKESPEFVTRSICITKFDTRGQATQRMFADYAEHYSDGRSISIKPRLVTLDPEKSQLKASANTGTSMDDGESVVFTGNVLVTRAADSQHPPIRVSTTHATLYPDSNVVKSDGPVVIERGNDQMKAIGMTLDNVEHTLQLHSNVETFTVLPKKARKNK